MSIFFWQKNQLIDQFSKNLADQFYSSIPPPIASSFFIDFASADDSKNPKKDKQLQQRVVRALNSTILQIQQFRELHSLRIYGKARLHLTFVDRLKELGYQDRIAEEVNRLILLQTP